MKNSIIAGFLGCTLSLFAQMDTLNWSMKEAKSGEWLVLGQKGTVQEVYLREGLLPDPFYGKNEELFNWIEEHHWEFVSKFILTAEEIKSLPIVLHFGQVDTYGKIYVNDQLVGETANAFHPHSFDISSYAKEGVNDVKVVLTPPVIYHKDRWESEKFHYPAPNDVHKVAIAPLTRKPQYQFGWDWALRLNTLGFWKPATVRIGNHFDFNYTISTDSLVDNKAFLTLRLNPQEHSLKPEIWHSALFGELAFDQAGVAQVEIENPELWWPRGQGEPHLYQDKWTVKSGDKEWVKSVKFGVRTSRIEQNEDQWGTSFELFINDRKIFCKGADYIPQDIIPTRVSDREIQDMVDLALTSNFNMLRIWGGGYYPDEILYERCNELGIMVWQDLMFACSMYPGDDEFLKNVQREFNYQIPRFTKHPSVVYVNGNNEVAVAWKYWGFQLRYGLMGKAVDEIEHAYDTLFKSLAPSTVSKWSSLPYVHTSPLSHWGKDEFYKHGTQHYWGVWHGSDPMEDFGRKSGRFNAEYGFQSFPEFKTLNTFSTSEDWSLKSDVMKHHQKSYVGNGMIEKHADRLYGKSSDFRQFVYYSQLTQARAVGIAISSHRTDWPRCTGTLYWQLNDCWPAPTWSSLDVDNHWKALQYKAKDLYRDVAVLAKEETIGDRQYYLVSDQPKEFQCPIEMQVFDLTGKKLFKNELGQLVKGHDVAPLCVKSLEQVKHQDYLVVFAWKDANGIEQKADFVHHTGQKTTDNSPKQIELTVNIQSENTFEIQITTNSFLEDFWLFSESKDIHALDNFLNLLPGKHTIIVRSNEQLTADDLKYMYR